MIDANMFNDTEGTDIAIIGLAGRFPGAHNVDQFWQNLCAGVESITRFSDEELLNAGIEPALLNNPSYVKAGAIIDDIDLFDATFFGLTPKEAQIMDPQHRLFIETVWQALENAGYDPEAYQKSIGLYAGSAISTYLLNNIYPNSEVVETVGTIQAALGNDKDSLTTRVAYLLNLTGPCYSVQTYCSTSLVAVSIACSSLLNGECDMALAGGVALSVPQRAGYYYQEGGIASPDARCRAFDAEANGSPLGNGVGIVVLKRLEDALHDGDHIYAVIKGSAINNDGSVKAGFTAPGVRGQSGVILEALANADIEADTIDYIEAHGTGTPLGDAIELAALIKAFRKSTDRKQFCALGSVKTNVGHLDRAAGVTGLIKTSLALKHRLMPPSLNFRTANTQVDLANSPFFVNTQLTEWKSSGKPRRAGVSAFGLGGTNAHVIVDEAPIIATAASQRSQHLLLLSARSEAALEAATRNLGMHLQAHPELNLADVAYTLQVGRRAFAHRRMLVCGSAEDAQGALNAADSSALTSHELKNMDRPLAWLFAGVGEQYVGMGRDLYEHEAIFRQTVDQCCELALRHGWLTRDLRSLLSPAQRDVTPQQEGGLDLAAMLGRSQTSRSPEQALLQQTEYAQPAVFIVEYALAQLLLHWGLRPAALIGYSLGEYVAACVAGSLRLPDALQLVCRRAQLIATLPPGAMLAVPLSPEQVQPWLSDAISLAIINSERQCVLAGTPQAIAALQERLEQAEIVSRLIPSSHAFHSPLLAPVQSELDALAASISMQPPQIPYLSNVTGDWFDEQDRVDPHYWSRHLCQTVHFAAGVQRLWQQGQPVLVEIGPGQSLGAFVKQVLADEEEPPVVVPTLRARFEQGDDGSVALAALGKLWLAGVPVPWQSFWQDEPRRRVPLPTYPFERQRYWIEPKKVRFAAEEAGSKIEAIINNTLERKADLADWFYLPSWKQTLPSQPGEIQTAEDEHGWLIFADECGLGMGIKKKLASSALPVITVLSGDSFARIDSDTYRIHPGKPEDYAALLRAVMADGHMPDRIIHLWTVNTDVEQDHNIREYTAHMQQSGFYSLINLVQALNDLGVEHCQISLVSNHLHDVTGTDQLCPAKATALGPIRVIPQEYSHIICRSIDVMLPQPGSWQEELLIEQLVCEVRVGSADRVIAFRGAHRWTQIFEPVRLQGKAEPAPILREGGTYLILGGLGGIGQAIAGHLARTVKARLVLTGRSGLPARENWEQILAQHSEEAEIVRRIRQVQELEEQGAEILVLAADVTDAEQVCQVIQCTIEAYGALHGVIHVAAVPPEGLIQLKEPAMAAKVLAPKVDGTLILDQALLGQALDFMLLFSSVSAVTGGLGEVDYCAANAFLDAFAHFKKSRASYPVISINWGPWQWDAWASGLAGFPEEAQVFFKERRSKYGITFEEGMTAIERILAYRLPQVFVSPQDLPTVVEGIKDISIAMLIEMLQRYRQTTSKAGYSRPVLGTPYVAPESEIEQEVVAIWTKLLGIEQIGIHDNFFELGGHSLMGTQLMGHLRQAFQVNLPLSALFDSPTVAELALLIEATILEEIESMPEEEVENLV